MRGRGGGSLDTTQYTNKLKCEYIIIEANGMYMYMLSIHLLPIVIYTYLPFYQRSY